MSDYWNICIEEAFDEIGIVATKEQVSQMAKWVEGAHDNHGMAHGYDVVGNPQNHEIARLEKRLKAEINMVTCRACNGHGTISESFGPIGRSSTSVCDYCHGKGRL